MTFFDLTTFPSSFLQDELNIKYGKGKKPDFDSDPGWEGVEDWLHPKVPIQQVRDWLLFKRQSLENKKPVCKKPKGVNKNTKKPKGGKGKKTYGKKQASKEETNRIQKSVTTVCKSVKGKQEKITYQRGINEFITKTARLG